MVFSAVGSVGLITLVIGRLLIGSFRVPLRSFQDNLIGQVAEVRVRIRPGKPGKVFINGEFWNAAAETNMAQGTLVEVKQVEGLLLLVAAASESKAESPAEPGAAS